MSKSISGLVINIATAVYLFAAGILCFLPKGNILKGFFGGPIYTGTASIFKDKDLVNVIAIILAVIAIAGAIFIIMRMLNIKVPALNLFMVILAIFWLVIVVLNIIAVFKTKDYGFWRAMLDIAANGLVLGGILASTEQFGG